MEIIGQSVRHETFGEGIVTGRNGVTLTVRFPGGDRRFLYPDAFSHFLVLQDSDMQQEMQSAMEQKQEEKHRQEEIAHEKWEREANLRNMKISARAQAVFDVKPNQTEDVFSRWQVSTGVYLSGYAKGEPRIPDRVKANSMCLLTVRPPQEPESSRYIAGFFMAPEDFEGSQAKNGWIEAHEAYRVRLPEAVKPLFWPYLTREKSKQKWGNTTFKYLTNVLGERILRETLEEMTDKVSREEMQNGEKFYQYYCRLNRLQPIRKK